jgi:hypothetical protein
MQSREESTRGSWRLNEARVGPVYQAWERSAARVAGPFPYREAHVYAYIYQAALLCEECGEKTRAMLADAGKAPADPDDETSYDSGEFPKGPESDGGGEADCPQHCDHCGAFLENSLTSDGNDYVVNAIREARLAGQENRVCITEWEPFYDDLPTVPYVLARVYEIAGVNPGETLPQYTSPGSYTILYCTKRGECACAACASEWSDSADPIAHAGAFDEGAPEECAECGKAIESSYGDPEVEEATEGSPS